MATTTKKVPMKRTGKRDNPAGVKKSAVVSEQDVRFRVYEIFQMRVGNGLAGDATSDWLQAEEELVSRTLAAVTRRRVQV